MKFRPVGAQLLQTRRTDMNGAKSRFPRFSERAHKQLHSVQYSKYGFTDRDAERLIRYLGA